MKRILVVSLAYYPDHVGGAEVAIKEITDRIPDAEFHMITLRFDSAQPEQEMIGAVHVHRVGFGGAYLSKILFIPLAALKGRSLHARLHFDGAWAMMSYMLLPIIIMRLLGARVPYALTLQEGDTYEQTFERPLVRFVSPLFDYGFRHASVVQVISNFLAGWAPRRGYRGSIEVIPNGASLQSAQEYPAEKIEALKQALGKNPGDVFLVTVSRLVHKNAVDDCIRAIALLPSHIKLLVVGGGPDEAMLKTLVAELGVQSRVIFVGQVDRTQTALYRKVSDIFVRPSRSEGMGNSFVSTMVAGLPVIATQEGGIADLLFDAKRNPDKPTTGWAVDKDSPEQIASAVREILADPEQARRVVETAKKFARDNFDWDTIAKAMRERVFSKII